MPSALKRKSVTVLLILIALIAGYQTALILTSPRSSQTPAINQWAMEKTCTYIIFTDGTYTYGQNCDTGAIDYGGPSNLGGATGTLPETVINLAISHGGKIFIKAGTYTFTTAPISLPYSYVAAIGTTSVSNMELYGEGSATILAAGTNLNAAVIGISGVSNWYVHDLQINGNRAQQSASGAMNPPLVGFFAMGSVNVIVENLFVHDCKTYGIGFEGVTNSKIMNNYIVDSNANGISDANDNGLGFGGNIISGNTVLYASDVGISVYTDTNVLVEDNIVKYMILDISPFGANTGIGIDIEGISPGDTNVVVTGNLVANLTDGIESAPTGTTNTQISITGNHVYNITGTNYPCGIPTQYTSQLLIQDNMITPNHSGIIEGVYIGSTETNAIISANDFVGCWESVVVEGSNTLITENNIQGSTNVAIADFGTATRIINNLGYNPVGAIASSFVSSGDYILDSGGAATPVNKTAMTVWESPKLIIVVTGTYTTAYTLVIKVDGTQVISINNPAANLVYSFTLKPGETFWCQYHTNQTTFVVSGE